MKRIGIECESIEGETWGIGRLILKLLQEIDKDTELKKEFKFVLYFKSKIPDHEFLKNQIFEKKIVKIPIIKSFSLYYYFLLPVKLWFEKLDLMYFPNYMLPHLFRGRSLVHLTNDIFHEMNSPSQKWRYRIAYRIFGTWAAEHANHIMTLSHFAKNELNHLMNIPQDKITVNHLGVEIGKPNASSKYGKEKYLLYLGQAFPRRHAKETMLAFEKISKEFDEYSLYVVGNDLYRPKVLDKLSSEINERLGRSAIVRMDRVSSQDITDLYANAVLTIYVSDKEAFGLPPLEALALGSIPVVADNGLTHEELGESGFFVSKMHDVDILASVIRDGLTNVKKRNEIKNAAPLIVNRFTWKAHADRFLNLIRLMTQHEK